MSQFFMTVVECHKKVEVRREVLAEISDFEPLVSYNGMLRYDQGCKTMTQICIQRFLSNNKIKVETDFKGFMTHSLNATNPMELPYNEFLRVVLPTRRKKLREKVLRKQSS